MLASVRRLEWQSKWEAVGRQLTPIYGLVGAPVCVVCLRGLAVVNQLTEQSGGQVQTGKLIKFMLISQGGGARH